MITYTTLENVSHERLFDSFMKAFVGFRIVKEVDLPTFSEMLSSQNYDPRLSIGALDSDTGELISFVLNSIQDHGDTAYVILTGTVPDYRRCGIARTIFKQIIELLKENQIKSYTTEVLKTNPAALNLYQSLGFEIQNEVTKTIKTLNGSRSVTEYKIVLNIR